MVELLAEARTGRSGIVFPPRFRQPLIEEIRPPDERVDAEDVSISQFKTGGSKTRRIMSNIATWVILMFAGIGAVEVGVSLRELGSTENAVVARTSSSEGRTQTRGPETVGNEKELRDYLRKHGSTVPSSVRQIDIPKEDIKLLGNVLSQEQIDKMTTKFPPSMFVVSGAEISGACNDKLAAGCYFPGTNILLLNDEKNQHTRVHELVHYMHWLVSQKVLAYVSSGSLNPVEMTIPRRLDEGTTESITHRLLGQSTAGISYPVETRMLALVELVAGQTETFNAYFSGDWTEVQKKVDEKLGALTFEKLLALLKTDPATSIGNSSDADTCASIRYLLQKIHEQKTIEKELKKRQKTETVWNNAYDMCK